jgi:hypothetical protein
MARGWRYDARVGEVLDESDLLYVAVDGSKGPHVTPAVFERDGGRLWFITPRRSVKAKVIERRRQVAGLVVYRDRAVLVGGRARITDPLTGRGLTSVGRLLDLPLAGAGYLAHNTRHLLGTLRDEDPARLALSRVVISVDIHRVALLRRFAVEDAWGDWDESDLLPRGPAPAGHIPDLAPLPSAVGGLLAADGPVVIGWPGLSGPVALPGHWRSASGVVETSAAAMALAGAAPSGPACLTAQRSRYRLKSKQGVILSGEGRAATDGDLARVAVGPGRMTWWVGDRRRSAGDAPGQEAVAAR